MPVLQARMAIGPSAYHTEPIDTSIVVISQEIDYEPDNNASNFKRSEYWQNEGTVGRDAQMQKWKRGLVSFIKNKESYFQSDRGRRVANLFSDIGLAVHDIDEDKVQAFYDIYFNGGMKSSHINLYVPAVVAFYENVEEFREDAPMVKKLSRVFGDELDEIETQKIELLIKTRTKKGREEVLKDLEKLPDEEQKRYLELLARFAPKPSDEPATEEQSASDATADQAGNNERLHPGEETEARNESRLSKLKRFMPYPSGPSSEGVKIDQIMSGIPLKSTEDQANRQEISGNGLEPQSSDPHQDPMTIEAVSGGSQHARSNETIAEQVVNEDGDRNERFYSHFKSRIPNITSRVLSREKRPRYETYSVTSGKAYWVHDGVREVVEVRGWLTGTGENTATILHNGDLVKVPLGQIKYDKSLYSQQQDITESRRSEDRREIISTPESEELISEESNDNGEENGHRRFYGRKFLKVRFRTDEKPEEEAENVSNGRATWMHGGLREKVRVLGKKAGAVKEMVTILRNGKQIDVPADEILEDRSSDFSVPEETEVQETVALDTEIHEDEQIELAERAKEIADSVRTNGMGIVEGKFPPSVLPEIGRALPHHDPRSVTTALGFIKRRDAAGKNAWFSRLIHRKTPLDLMGKRQRDNRRIWIASNYRDAIREEVRYEKSRFLRRRINPETYWVYNDFMGLYGDKNWIQYDYYMPAAPNKYDQSPGKYFNLSIAVPPSTADEINIEVARNPHFPDFLFQALYPGKVGEDPDSSMTPLPSDEIQILDLRITDRRNGLLDRRGTIHPLQSSL